MEQRIDRREAKDVHSLPIRGHFDHLTLLLFTSAYIQRIGYLHLHLRFGKQSIQDSRFMLVVANLF